MRRQYQQRIEPTASLIDALRNEIPRERAFEQLFVLERVMALRVWHTTRLEPAIEDLLNALEIPFTLFRRNSDVVNCLPVQISDAFDARKLFKLCNGTDTHNLDEIVMNYSATALSKLACLLQILTCP